MYDCTVGCISAVLRHQEVSVSLILARDFSIVRIFFFFALRRCAVARPSLCRFASHQLSLPPRVVPHSSLVMSRLHSAAAAAALLGGRSSVRGGMRGALSSPSITATLCACVARPAPHAPTATAAASAVCGGRFLFRRFASAAAPAAATTKDATATADAAAAAAAVAANSARVRADEAHAHAMNILRSHTCGAGGVADTAAAASANGEQHSDEQDATDASPHAAFATLLHNASMEQQQQRAAGSSASDASAQANSAAASSMHSTASAAAAHAHGADETAALLTPAASASADPFAAESDASSSSAPPAFFADVHPNAQAVDPALLSQLGMEEEELAALWRDYVHAQTQTSNASASAAAAGRSVRTGLASFPSPPSLDDPSSLEHVSRQTFAMQCALESSAISHHAREYQTQAASVIKLGKGSQLGPASSMLLSWYTPFVEQLNEQLMAYARELDAPPKPADAHHHPSRGRGVAGSKPRGEDSRTVGLHLLQLSAPELACITMHELFGLCLLEPTGVKFIAACLAVGKAVNLEVKLAAIRSNKSEWKAMVQALNPLGNHAAGAAAQITAPAASSSSGGAATVAPAVSAVSAAPAPSHAFHFSPTAANLAEVRRRARRVHSETWNDALLARVGSTLLNVFMKVAAVPQSIIEEAEAQEAAARLENAGLSGAVAAASSAAANAARSSSTGGSDAHEVAESPLAFGSTFIPPLQQKGPRALHGGASALTTPQKFYPAFQVSAKQATSHGTHARAMQ